MSDHTEDTDTHYASLVRRAASLNRLLSIKTVGPMPKCVVAMHLKTLLMAGIGYCGAELRDWWLGWFDQRIRLDAWLCEFCGRRRNADPNLCDGCIEDAKREDFEADDPKGGLM